MSISISAIRNFSILYSLHLKGFCPGCAQPSIALQVQNHGLKHHSFYVAGFGYRPQYSASQSSQFTDFLLRANKYQALQIFSADRVQRKVILVEVRASYSIYLSFICSLDKREMSVNSNFVYDMLDKC